MDVLSASLSDDKIAWYENDGNGKFSKQKIISSKAGGAISVYASDIDGDGDMDVLSASLHDHKIAWYQNDGNGKFSKQKIISSKAFGASSVYASDIDGDGDMDVLSASGTKITWYKNKGNGKFPKQKIIASQTNSAIYFYVIYATDIDGDGDMDVLSASVGDDKIAWYENLQKL